MTAKHTPGPWHIGMKPGPMIYGEHGEQVADMVVSMINIVEHSANARLIAAAPDLLAVAIELEESAAYWSEYDVPIGIVDRIRAAIAKAMGE